jgi:hypothetical protein
VFGTRQPLGATNQTGATAPRITSGARLPYRKVQYLVDETKKLLDVGAVRNRLSESRHASGLYFHSVHISAGGKKQESHWAWLAPATRLTSCLMRVDWPAQPYLNLAQDYFNRIS